MNKKRDNKHIAINKKGGKLNINVSTSIPPFVLCLLHYLVKETGKSKCSLLRKAITKGILRVFDDYPDIERQNIDKLTSLDDAIKYVAELGE